MASASWTSMHCGGNLICTL
uniref:Uncharacterized protein n=1 Tax=Arundo donax TaxID=35708 RepID=A0A0A9U4T8_ARUDO